MDRDDMTCLQQQAVLPTQVSWHPPDDVISDTAASIPDVLGICDRGLQ